MSDWPELAAYLSPIGSISPSSPCGIGIGLGAYASAAWPAANLAMYVPFRVVTPIIATQMFVLNGGTANGDIDIGIYDSSGTRLISSGATAQSGTNTFQLIDITDTLLGPGQFYLAISLSSGTGTTTRVNTSSAQLLQCYGLAQEASAHPLPVTATFATIGQAYVPIFGLTTQAVV